MTRNSSYEFEERKVIKEQLVCYPQQQASREPNIMNPYTTPPIAFYSKTLVFLYLIGDKNVPGHIN